DHFLAAVRDSAGAPDRFLRHAATRKAGGARMSGWLSGSLAVFDLVLLSSGLALSQYVVLRAGVFSVATPALASIGAYTAGILTLRTDAGAWAGLLAAAAMGTVVALILSVPLARLRGVFQAIATVAFCQIVLSL